ncbi:MAG TPA: universal stress protein [Candidatus Binatia bacterium]|nr:universal stress protein [Candidatus Binatia bacterium]
MSTPRHLLVGLDGSPLAETILGTVGGLATRLHAEVTLLHVTPVPAGAGAAEPDATLDRMVAEEVRRARRYLDDVTLRLARGGPTVRTAVATGDPATEIVRHAERAHADVIALATHGRTGVRRWLHGSVADAVLHTATTPLLLLRPARDEAAPRVEIRRLVAAVDGSPAAEAALPVVEDLARALGVPVLLLRVVEPIDLAFGADPFGGAYVDQARVLERLREGAERHLAKLAVGLRAAGIVVETLAPVGTPVDTIAAVTRRHPGSLLVLGTHGRTGWRAAALGSVARRVVLAVESPVLVVRRPGR